jgi:UDP-2,3-diacylglucosamine pyrophosphatase LpxH
MFFPKEHVVILANINLLILHTDTFKQFLEVVHVFRHLVTCKKNLANQIHELFATID